MKCEVCKIEESTHDADGKPMCPGCWFDWFTKSWHWAPDEDRTLVRAYFITNGEMP